MKVIALLLGLAIGFGAGVWWGVRNPAKAESLAAEEERRVLEAKIAITQAVKEKLDRIIASQKATSAPAGRGFVAGASRAAPLDPELLSLRDQQQRELEDLQRQFNQTARK